MDSEAVAALQLVKGPVGVISICGRARQGKSFVLNQLLGRSSGFQVASTHRPCTNGLWLWSAPLKRTTPDGTEVNLLFLDSEGIDAWDQKDFCLSLVENGVRLKLNEYLELALSQIPGSAEDIVAKKKIRDSIQDIFPDRQCFTLVRPTDNLIDLQGGVDEIELDQLSAEFRSGLDALKEFIFERTRPKEIGETMMTGPLLIDVITSYLDAINNGAVSTISSPWEDYRRSVYLEADLQCLNLIQRMEKSLRDASDASDANMDDIVKVLEALLLEYKASSHGPGKWQLLAVFLQQSLEGPMVHLTKKLIEKANSGMQSLSDAMKSQPEWVENMENSQSEALARFTDPMRRRIVVQEKLLDSITSLKEQNIELSHTLDSTKKESSRWKRKYEEAQSAQEEAEEWQSKYNDATTDAKSKLAKADVELQDTIKKANEKESDMRGRFSLQMAEKDEEIKNKKERLEYVGQRLEAITSKSAVSELEEKYESLEREIETLKQDKVHLEGTCKSFEREVEILQQDKDNLEEQCKSKSEQIDEVLTRVSFLQDEVKRATDEVAKVQTDAYIGKQLEAKRLAEVERAAAEEATRAVGEIKILEAQRNYLEKKLETSRASHAEASRHAASLMAEDEERKREIESIQASKTEKMTSYAKVIENLVSKRGDLLAFVKLAEELSHELQDAHAKIDNLYPGLIRVGLNETAAVDEVQAGFRQKRPREDDIQMGEGSGQEMDTGVRLGGNKKHRITPSPPSPQTDRHAEDGGSMRGENNS